MAQTTLGVVNSMSHSPKSVRGNPNGTARCGCGNLTSSLPPRQGINHITSSIFSSQQGLDEFDAIAEGVAKFKTFKAGDGDRIENRQPRLLQPLAPRSYVIHLIRDVGFGGRSVGGGLDADVKLVVAHGEP